MTPKTAGASSGWLAAGMVALCLSTSVPLVAQQAELRQIDELDTALVSGEHPGPGLWKISKGDNVMWVLGTYGPLPKGMTWRSQTVEARIAESQEVILPATVEVDIGMGFFRTVTLIPAMVKAMYLPDKKTLQDVLPAATLGKWRSLRNKYFGRSESMDRLRPSVAISVLRDKAYERSRLTEGPEVESIVKSAAKKRKVRVRSLRDVEPKMKTRSSDIRTALTGMTGMSDVECFTRDLGQLESDIELLKQRANAWSRGDVEALRHLHEKPDIVSACEDVFEASVTSGDTATAARMKKLGEDYDMQEAKGKAQAQKEWLAAASKALQKNRSTFALLPIREVVGTDGYVAKLKELGYEVEGQ
jgi:uncharacterized protein YbaP (TraB family)